MKKIAIKTVDFYQVFLHTLLVNILGVNSFCRFETTCSNYAKLSIEKYGIFTGGRKSFVRILKCQPFYKGN